MIPQKTTFEVMPPSFTPLTDYKWFSNWDCTNVDPMAKQVNDDRFSSFMARSEDKKQQIWPPYN